MDVTLFRDYRQGPDWLAVGKFAICLSCDVDVLNIRAAGGHLRSERLQGRWRPGPAVRHSDAGEPGAPSQRRQGVHQLALVAQRANCIAEGYRKRRKPLRFAAIDIPKDEVPYLNRRLDGVKYLDTSLPEWQEMKPIIDVMNEALKSAGKN